MRITAKSWVIKIFIKKFKKPFLGNFPMPPEKPEKKLRRPPKILKNPYKTLGGGGVFNIFGGRHKVF